MAKYSLLNQDINTSFFNIETTWVGMRSSLVFKQIGSAIPDSFCELIKGETLNYFQKERPAKVFSHACAQQIISNQKLLIDIKKAHNRLAQQIIELSSAFFPVPKLNDREIINFLNKSRKLQGDFAAWGMVVAFADVYGEISRQIIKIFAKRKNLPRPVNFYLENLTNPTQPSLTAQAYEAIAFSKNDRQLIKKYFWLDQGYIGRGLTTKELIEIRRHYSQKRQVKIAREQLLKELSLNSAEQHLLTVSSDMVFVKSLRADLRQALYVVTNRIVDLLAARWKVPAKYLEVLSTKELITAIRNPKKIPSNLVERFTSSIIIPKTADDYEIIYGPGVPRFLAKNVATLKEADEEITELKGQIAQPGKAKGRVKLVFGSQHNNKVKRGDILVSVATSPQLLPAMKLAAAFVTDVGGVTSHAAIVARELRRPCVVGTKVATKFLHDGDLVEVDANKGVVKIIKSK